MRYAVTPYAVTPYVAVLHIKHTHVRSSTALCLLTNRYLPVRTIEASTNTKYAHDYRNSTTCT